MATTVLDSVLTVPCSPQGQSVWLQRTTLDGTDYILRFAWSQREGGWFLSIFTQDETPLLLSRRLTPGWPLLVNVRAAYRPPGELVLYDSAEPVNSGATHPRYADVTDAGSGIGAEPTFDGLGGRWQLLYYPAAVLA